MLSPITSTNARLADAIVKILSDLQELLHAKTLFHDGRGNQEYLGVAKDNFGDSIQAMLDLIFPNWRADADHDDEE